MDLLAAELPRLVSAVVVAVVSALVTVQVALRRYRGEQWWSRKAESYASVFAALHDMKKFLQASLEDQVGHVAQGPDRLVALREGWQRAQDSLAKAVDTGAFLFAPTVVTTLQQLQADLSAASVNDFSWEHLLGRIDLLERCLAALRSQGRTDLKIS